jgi:hypothetical protein
VRFSCAASTGGKFSFNAVAFLEMAVAFVECLNGLFRVLFSQKTDELIPSGNTSAVVFIGVIKPNLYLYSKMTSFFMSFSFFHDPFDYHLYRKKGL